MVADAGAGVGSRKTEAGISSGFKCAATIDSASIPAKPVEGEVNGAKFTPASAGFWEEGAFGGSSLMFRAPLGKEAGCDRFFAETRLEVTVEPIADAALGKPVTKAKNANFIHKKDDGTPVSSNSELAVFVQVDSIEKKRGGKVKGKVAICFKDEKKSWLAGTFEADWCE